MKQSKRSDEAGEESLRGGILTAAISTDNPTTRRKRAIIQLLCVPVNRKQTRWRNRLTRRLVSSFVVPILCQMEAERTDLIEITGINRTTVFPSIGLDLSERKRPSLSAIDPSGPTLKYGVLNRCYSD